MPLYDYACTQCGRTHEVRHGFNETYDRACEACGAPLRRVFNAAPVLFKGSGFYVTDSRGSSAAKTESAAEKPKESPSEAKSEAAPAKETSEKTKAADSAA